jgi:hypothetical protein
MSFARLLPGRSRVLLLAAVACVLLGTMIGLSRAGARTELRLAGVSAVGGKIHACVAVPGGAVRFIAVNARCAHGEKGVIILQKAGPTGPRGKTGKQGKQGIQGIQGIQGVAGPTGPANTEVVSGPVVTLTGGASSTGQTAVSTAGCDHSLNGANSEAYGGGVVVTPHNVSGQAVVVPVESSYPGVGITGNTQATPAGAGVKADAFTGVAVVSRLVNTDTATVQAFVVCGP